MHVMSESEEETVSDGPDFKLEGKKIKYQRTGGAGQAPVPRDMTRILPEEITLKILGELSLVDISRFLSTCRDWKALRNKDYRLMKELRAEIIRWAKPAERVHAMDNPSHILWHGDELLLRCNNVFHFRGNEFKRESHGILPYYAAKNHFLSINRLENRISIQHWLSDRRIKWNIPAGVSVINGDGGLIYYAEGKKIRRYDFTAAIITDVVTCDKNIQDFAVSKNTIVTLDSKNFIKWWTIGTAVPRFKRLWSNPEPLRHMAISGNVLCVASTVEAYLYNKDGVEKQREYYLPSPLHNVQDDRINKIVGYIDGSFIVEVERTMLYRLSCTRGLCVLLNPEEGQPGNPQIFPPLRRIIDFQFSMSGKLAVLMSGTPDDPINMVYVNSAT